MKKAIVIGASSGIGCELAKILSKNGYVVGLMARRLHLLSEWQSQIKGETHNKTMATHRLVIKMDATIHL